MSGKFWPSFKIRRRRERNLTSGRLESNGSLVPGKWPKLQQTSHMNLTAETATLVGRMKDHYIFYKETDLYFILEIHRCVMNWIPSIKRFIVCKHSSRVSSCLDGDQQSTRVNILVDTIFSIDKLISRVRLTRYLLISVNFFSLICCKLCDKC